MRKYIYIALLLCISIHANAQYISEVLEYKPAPGQLINEAPWGIPSSAESIVGGVSGSLSLGAWGGYVVFRFNSAVENHPDNPFGVDFTIFGNPMQDWSEPGVVWVMNDENGNGVPDDTWYQLAGSDYHFSNTAHNYNVTYINPQSTQAADVPWEDNLENSGFVYANSSHTQPYYPLADSFPQINQEQYQLHGSRIFPEVDSTSFMVKIYKRGFGYADNQFRGTAPYDVPDNPYTTEIENSGGDAFDISWAVDSDGNYVQLDEIHFVKVQNGVMVHGGWLGEASTEITGAVDVAPNVAVTGENEMVGMRDLPPVIRVETFQAEAYAFLNGKLQAGANLVWSVNMDGASVNENGTVTVTQSGNLELTAALEDQPEIKTTKTAQVDLGNAIHKIENHTLKLYPNPAKNHIRIDQAGIISIYSLAGKVILTKSVSATETINIETLPTGVYLVKCKTAQGVFKGRLLKN